MANLAGAAVADVSGSTRYCMAATAILVGGTLSPTTWSQRMRIDSLDSLS